MPEQMGYPNQVSPEIMAALDSALAARPQQPVPQAGQPLNLLQILAQMGRQPQMPAQTRPGGLLGALIQLIQAGNRQAPPMGSQAVPMGNSPMDALGSGRYGAARRYMNYYAQPDTVRRK